MAVKKLMSCMVLMCLMFVTVNVGAVDSDVYEMELPGVVVSKGAIEDSEYHKRMEQQRSKDMESMDVIISIALGDSILVADNLMSSVSAFLYKIKLKNGKSLMLYSSDEKFNNDDCVSVYLANKVNAHPILFEKAGKNRLALCDKIQQEMK